MLIVYCCMVDGVGVGRQDIINLNFINRVELGIICSCRFTLLAADTSCHDNGHRISITQLRSELNTGERESSVRSLSVLMGRIDRSV